MRRSVRHIFLVMDDSELDEEDLRSADGNVKFHGQNHPDMDSDGGAGILAPPASAHLA